MSLPPRLEALRKEIIAVVPCKPATRRVRADLDQMRFDEVILTFYNWAGRLVPARPREFSFVPDFWDDRAGAHSAAIYELAARMRRGEDVTAHLSKRVFTEGYVPRPTGKRRGPAWGGKDFALNAWDLHHLHLNPNGTGELLYVALNHQRAVAVMLGDHASFDDGSLEARVMRARARGGSMVMRGVYLPENLSSGQRIFLARHGISASANVDGKAVFGAMLASSGHSTFDCMRTAQALRMLKQLDPLLDDPAWLAAAAPTAEIQDPKWGFSGTDLCITSRDGQVGVPIVYGRC